MGVTPFCLISTSSATTPDDEEIAMILGAPPEIKEMDDMEKIECARSIADTYHGSRISLRRISMRKLIASGIVRRSVSCLAIRY